MKTIRGFKVINIYTLNTSKALKTAREIQGQYPQYSVKKIAHDLLYKRPSIPRRSTSASAGYDFRSNEDITIPVFHAGIRPVLVHTGIKAYFPKDEVLYIFNRSSNPLKRGLILANNTGVIDADYYNNPKNDGEICLEFYNYGTSPFKVHCGDRLAQGVFQKYLLADYDQPANKHIQTGFGASGLQ